MSAEELISQIAEGVFVLLAILTTVRAIRRPRRVKIHTAVFFGLLGFVVVGSWLRDLDILPGSRVGITISAAALVILPYPLLLLADDFTVVRPVVRRITELLLVLAVVGVAVFVGDLPGWFIVAVVAYFAGVTAYASAQFVQDAFRMRSVSRVRMAFAATASVALAALILVAGLQTFVSGWILSALGNLLGLVCGLCYYVAFAMPGWVKRNVHQVHLERFIRATIEEPDTLSDEASFARIETAVANAVGTPRARISLWDEGQGLLWSPSIGGRHPDLVNPRTTVPFRAYQTQKSIFTEDAGEGDPDNAALYSGMVLLTTPITLGDHRYGVLTAYGGLPPFVHDDDLYLLELMANQVAVVLRNRDLVSQLSASRAREQAMQLMDDFFHAVAHDLKTPLTTILGQGQRLERQVRRGGEVDVHAIESIVQQAKHMRRLVEDLLDDVRERGQYTSERNAIDLLALAQDVASQAPASHQSLTVEGTSVIAEVDEARMRQVLTNLVENAVKYSPGGGPIRILVSSEGDVACVAVSDQGVGIPPGDLRTIFERFSRGSREPDRRFSGLGLGLYTCRRIVEEHGGRIDVESQVGVGSTFTVRVPIEALPLQGPEFEGPAGMIASTSPSGELIETDGERATPRLARATDQQADVPTTGAR